MQSLAAVKPQHIQCAEQNDLPPLYLVYFSLLTIVDWDEAESLFSTWLLRQEFEIQEFILGADRLTWRLMFANYDCVFHAELLTQSFWFESNDETTIKAIALGLV